MNTKIIVLLCLLLCPFLLSAQKTYEVKSPDGSTILKIEAGAKLQWSVIQNGMQIIAPSAISITLQNGEILGNQAKIVSSKIVPIHTSFQAINYRKNTVEDWCNQLTLICKGNYSIIFRVYDHATAYRFVTNRPGELVIKNEEANFNFTGDQRAFLPIQWDYRDGKIFNTSFEALYREINLSAFPEDSLAFLPVLIDAGENKKVELLEADLEDYPGMYLDLNETGKGLKGVFAPYPLQTYVKGLNVIPSERAGYIAKTSGIRSFPWRIVFISAEDKELLDCDMVQILASPSRLTDISWIKVGQVSWDWWNSINISHVDFRSGMNTESYKYYIDFAADYHLSYIILDEGWNVPGNLMQFKENIDLESLIAYGNSKNVGIILWCSWKDVLAQMDKAFPFIAKLGVKGLKIDFFDRDDQLAVASTYNIAKLAAENHLMVDYHGIFKPAGIQRTYPNVVGIEGVKGLENFKWADENQPRYCVTLPFIRNQAGPMDYTPGSMRNTNEENFRAISDMPMSKGTRVNQMAEYIIFEVPLQMLADNPTIYRKEHECTEFITKIPTTYDAIVPLESKVAEYVSLARKKGDKWYVGAMTDWTPREITIDFSFLDPGVTYQAEVFSDGVNADRDATDYRKETLQIKKGDKIAIKLMNGGGWVAILQK